MHTRTSCLICLRQLEAFYASLIQPPQGRRCALLPKPPTPTPFRCPLPSNLYSLVHLRSQRDTQQEQSAPGGQVVIGVAAFKEAEAPGSFGWNTELTVTFSVTVQRSVHTLTTTHVSKAKPLGGSCKSLFFTFGSGNNQSVFRLSFISAQSCSLSFLLCDSSHNLQRECGVFCLLVFREERVKTKICLTALIINMRWVIK